MIKLKIYILHVLSLVCSTLMTMDKYKEKKNRKLFV